MEGRKRQAGIELLRMVAMMMIVTMHFLANSGNLLEPGKPSDVSAVLGTILENFCLAAVNAYVFISGYFGYQGTFQVKRVLRFLCQIWFYSLLVPLVLMGLGISTGFQNGIYGILPYLFPIETEHYWFATSFLLLMLLMPFLNLAAQHLPKKTYQTALVVLFIFLSGIKSIVPVAFATDRYGYDLTWFVFVYLLAAYAGKYDENGIFHRFKTGRGNAAILFLLSAAAGMAIQFLMKDLGSFCLPYRIPVNTIFLCRITIIRSRYLRQPSGCFICSVPCRSGGKSSRSAPSAWRLMLWHLFIT